MHRNFRPLITRMNLTTIWLYKMIWKSRATSKLGNFPIQIRTQHCMIHTRDRRTEVLVLDCYQGTPWLGDDFINKVVDWSIRFLFELCVLCMHFRFFRLQHVGILQWHNYQSLLNWKEACSRDTTGDCRPLWSKPAAHGSGPFKTRSSFFCHPHLDYMALDSTRQWSILSVSGLLQAINVFSITFKRFRLIKHDSLQIKLYSAGTSSTLLLKYSNSQWRIVHKWREAAISAANRGETPFLTIG